MKKYILFAGVNGAGKSTLFSVISSLSEIEEPFFVGDAMLLGKKKESGIEEFAKYNIIEGDLYDAV